MADEDRPAVHGFAVLRNARNSLIFGGPVFGRFTIKALNALRFEDCKTVYPGSIPGVASNT